LDSLALGNLQINITPNIHGSFYRLQNIFRPTRQGQQGYGFCGTFAVPATVSTLLLVVAGVGAAPATVSGFGGIFAASATASLHFICRRHL
jgi:uncharacterized protein (DUF697 family)